ncbi:unnamed protein product [Phytomonas sp. EM1]|nr:unnamed protein product [Phytomonas sp. EM1]|eukprot:CCW60900.1 unnamed protein product [Phytomonas sp. isolate EM1]
MGGHSKKSGRGGGGHLNRQRQSQATKKKVLSRDPGVPDLKRIAEKMTRTVEKRNHSLLSLNSKGASENKDALDRGGRHTLSTSSALVQSQESSGNAFSKAFSPITTSVGGTAPNGDELSEEQRRANQRREMIALALRSTEKQHDYEAPTRLHGMGGEAGEDLDGWGDEDGVSTDRRGADRSLRRFYKKFQQVVESCDVLLQVVDARDPLGCRLTQLEQNIRSSYGEDRKKIVIVLNKVDMLPSKKVVDMWIHHFQSQENIPCIPFSATANGAVGQGYVHELFKQLRTLARSAESGERKSIVVGVIGYPNVGKSSIINALKRKNVVGVGNTPGFTTGNTEVELRSDIRIMDCPGVVSPGEGSGDVILRNAVRVSDLVNPFAPVQRLLERCTAVQEVVDSDDEDAHHHHTLQGSGVHPLAAIYGIGSFPANDVMAFIHLVGLRRGRLTKGGQVDEEATARMILSDWNDGRIAYYTYPPKVDELFMRSSGDYKALRVRSANETAAAEDEESPQLVSHLARGITMDGLPVFHLRLSTASANAHNRKKKWIHRYHAEEESGESSMEEEL